MPIAALRYNNPFDVSLPIAGWNGGGNIVGIQGQSGFGSFPDMSTGFQAGVHRLNSYITGQSSHGPKRTIKELNSVYATDPNWANGVATHSGLDPNAALDPNNSDQMRALQYGVLAQEMGPKNAATIFAQQGLNTDGLTAINKAMASPQSGGQATASAGAPAPASGQLSFGKGDSQDEDTRPSVGSLFGASDETKAKMHGFGARLVRAAAALSSISNTGQAGQLNSLAKSLEDQNKSDYQYMMGPNGQLVKINKDTGQASFTTLPGTATKGSFGVVMGKDSMGNPTPIGKIDHNTGNFTPYGGQSAQPQNSSFGVPISETNPLGLPDNVDDLKASGKAGEALANQVQGVYRGDIAYPAGGSRMTPDQRQLKAALGLYYPDMNSNDFNARKKFRESVADAKGNGRGAQYASYNHSINLLSQAADNVEKLSNSDNFLPVGVQQLYNSAKNQQNSQDRSGAAKNIDTTIVPSLMGETSKLYYGTQGGGQEERRVISKALTSSDTLTNQIEGLKTMRDQLIARGHVLEGEADKSYGKGAETYYPTDKAGQADLEKLNATIARLEDKRDGKKPADTKPAATGGSKPPLASFFQ